MHLLTQLQFWSSRGGRLWRHHEPGWSHHTENHELHLARRSKSWHGLFTLNHFGFLSRFYDIVISHDLVVLVAAVALKGLLLANSFCPTLLVYFSQLSGAARTQRQVEILFLSHFQPFLFIINLFQWFHTWKKSLKKCVLSYSIFIL